MDFHFLFKYGFLWLEGARGGLVGRAQRLPQTAVYQWVSAGEDLALQGRAPHLAKYIGLASSYPGSVVYVCILEIFQKVHRFPPQLNLPVVERP